MAQSSNQHVLSIYVMPFCFGSDRASELAERVRSWRIPNLGIRICDLSDPAVTRPDRVIALPAYLLDGQVISLGSPDEAWLFQVLTSLG